MNAPAGLFASHGTQDMTIQLAEDSPLGRKGQVVTLALTPADVHDPTDMYSTFLAGYRPFPFRADEVCPVIPKVMDEDYYRCFDQDDAFRIVEIEGSLQGDIPEVDPGSSLTKYKTNHQYIGSFVSQVTEENAQGLFVPRRAAARRCGWAMALYREYHIFVTQLGTLGNWDATVRTTLGATQKWNSGSASDPIADIQARVIASAQPVTDIWMNQLVGFTFLNHPKVRDYTRAILGDSKMDYTAKAVLEAGNSSMQADFTIPGLPPFHIVSSKYKNETTGLLAYILGNDVIITSTPQEGAPTDGETISTAYTFRTRGGSGVGYETREYRVEGRGPKGGTMLVAYRSEVTKITGSNCGGFIQSAYQ